MLALDDGQGTGPVLQVRQPVRPELDRLGGLRFRHFLFFIHVFFLFWLLATDRWLLPLRRLLDLFPLDLIEEGVAGLFADAHSFQVAGSPAPYESYIRLAERMNEVTPGKFPKKTLFVNSGAEAVENAVKIARAHTGRSGIIAFEDAFHGRTMMTLALTSKTHPYKAGFAPLPGDVYRIPYAYCYRCSYSLKYPSCDLFCARHLEDTFKRVVASEDVAAVIAEPVLGEGGFVVPPPDYFRVLIDICHRHGVLFIADEVQSGFGRTGKLFASEHYGIEPDILVSAKSIGGGLPLAAITGRAEIMDAPGPGGLGGTFAGNPVSCAAALAVLDIFERENLLQRADELGDHFQKRAREWQRRWPMVGEVRGRGGMQLRPSRAQCCCAKNRCGAADRGCWSWKTAPARKIRPRKRRTRWI